MASPKAATIGAAKKSDLPEAVFAEPFNETLVHETARALGCSDGNVKSLSHHGMRALRAQLTHHDLQEDHS